MISKKKTTVSVLRQLIGISLEDFAELIRKSPSTVASLESGRLKLSYDTALAISFWTGVSVNWLLDGKPRSTPYWDDGEGNQNRYTKEWFEKIRASDESETKYHEEHTSPAQVASYGVSVMSKWLSIHAKAWTEKKVDLANYLVRNFLDDLDARLGSDDEAFFEQNRDARFVDAEGTQYQWLLEKPEDAKKLENPLAEQTRLVLRQVRERGKVKS